MIVLPVSEMRKFGGSSDVEFDVDELRDVAFLFEDRIDERDTNEFPVTLDAARLARRALFALADRIERDG